MNMNASMDLFRIIHSRRNPKALGVQIETASRVGMENEKMADDEELCPICGLWPDTCDCPECLAGPHCMGCGLKNCPIDEGATERNRRGR